MARKKGKPTALGAQLARGSPKAAAKLGKRSAASRGYKDLAESGRKGGLAGGRAGARALNKSLTARQRSSSASNAAKARWAKKRVKDKPHE